MGSLKSEVQGEDGDEGGESRVTAQGAVARALVNRRRAPHYVWHVAKPGSLRRDYRLHFECDLFPDLLSS